MPYSYLVSFVLVSKSRIGLDLLSAFILFKIYYLYLSYLRLANGFIKIQHQGKSWSKIEQPAF